MDENFYNTESAIKMEEEYNGDKNKPIIELIFIFYLIFNFLDV